MPRFAFPAIYFLASILLLFCIFIQGPRGDEPTTYAQVVRASGQVFPKFNLTEVAYGISPLWTWPAGLFAALGLVPHLAGRLVSFTGWIACVLLIGKKRETLLGALCLLHPALLVFAARCHPFWLAMPCLLAAARLPSSVARYFLISASASLHLF